MRGRKGQRKKHGALGLPDGRVALCEVTPLGPRACPYDLPTPVLHAGAARLVSEVRGRDLCAVHLACGVTHENQV